jgi:hypothetical protein
MATDKLLIIGLAALVKPFVVVVFLCFVRVVYVLLNNAIPDGKIKQLLNKEI